MPLWYSQKQQRLRTATIRAMIALLVDTCALRGSMPSTVSAHTLRYTFAQHYLNDNPSDLLGLATLLGHRSLDTTRIYGQPTAEQLAKRVEHLNLNAYDKS
jgi:site-specific recombinase XerD